MTVNWTALLQVFGATLLVTVLVVTLFVLGMVFQIPVGILALTRLRVITVKQLRKNRRYAIVVIAVLAMLLPGTDPVTMLLCMGPLVVLYELSILLASIFAPKDEVEIVEPEDPHAV